MGTSSVVKLFERRGGLHVTNGESQAAEDFDIRSVGEKKIWGEETECE
jgi:hypothetical protein